jgi:Dullard-like phosphatase family protein
MQSFILSRPAIVFDLDETLVFTTPIAPRDAHMSIRIGRRRFYIRTRPGLEPALRDIAEHFDIFFFTSSDPAYANPIIDAIAPGTPPEHRFFRESCCLTDGYSVKDLRLLNRPLDRILIIDDIDGSALFQPNNLIRITPWFGDENDKALCAELVPLLLSHLDDGLTPLPDAIARSLGAKEYQSLHLSQNCSQ